MRRCLIGLMLVAVASSSACNRGGNGEATVTDERAVSGAEAPEAAVTGLLSSLEAGEYDQAVTFGITEQLPVVALAEGASLEQVSGLMASGDVAVGANFWKSFTEGLGTFVGVAPEQVRLAGVTPFEVEGRRFARVAVEFPNDPNMRSFVVQDDNGWKIDLLASFAPALAGRLEAAVAGLRAEPDAADVLDFVAAQRPSLQAVLEDPNLPPEVDQDVRAALLAIAR